MRKIIKIKWNISCKTLLAVVEFNIIWDITSHLSEWLLSKIQQITSVGKDALSLCTYGGNVNWCSHCEKQYEDSSKTKIKLLLLLLNRFSRVQLCATSETASHQAPPSLGFSRQEHWSGLPFPSPKLLHDPAISPRCFSEENENINSKRHMHCVVYFIESKTP